jgi:Lar family restriction alleviation protein
MPCATCEHDPRCQDVCQHSSCATGQGAPKPCPFCGGAATVDAQFGREWWVECDDCAASTGGMEATREAAIAAWNRRAPDVGKAQAPSPPDELRRAVRKMTESLRGREWAEHVSTDQDATELECAITDLIGRTPRKLTQDEIGALWRDLSARGHASDWNDFWNVVRFTEQAIAGMDASATLNQSAPSPLPHLLEAGKEEQRG